MTDITPPFAEALQKYDVSRLYQRQPWPKSDEFLKEAARICSHTASLHAYLRSIRQAYLSTAPPSRRTHFAQSTSASTQPHNGERQHFTDAQREQIDAESKQLLRELNAAIRNLSDAEQLRQNTESKLRERKHGRKGFRALGQWAAGGSGQAKSPEEEMEEIQNNGVKVHRENVLWYLRRKLEACGDLQRTMMETRVMREVEKGKSALYKAQPTRGAPPSADAVDGGLANWGSDQSAKEAHQWRGNKAAQMDELERSQIEQQLSPEQLQLFAQENQEMVKHYEETLDKVRTAEQSLVEISELQTSLANNLATQSAHIDQLTGDTFLTTENIGGGNKQLKRAAERKSTAKYVFYGSCAFSLFLVVYDLLI
ncbi:MAG: hypothetical protein M1833_004047 [Piccolia ochrophora]|nr:MAG: hypothetical protein M1833_004047 [Piccolia ochrophora]